MKKMEEIWAIFWCDTLKSIIYGDVEPEQTHQELKNIASTEVVFPDGRVGKPSLSTLKRKLRQYRTGGFQSLVRKPRNDQGKPRAVSSEVLAKAVELKKDQPFRSDKAINRMLKEEYGIIIPRSTLYYHLKQTGATRLKLGVLKKKVRGRWTREHTHDLWIGDFEEGPYVMDQGQVVPTYLSAFIDCHSRFIIEARYYLRQNLDVVIDAWIRALAKHGAPLSVYVDNAKVYLSHGLKMACHIINTRLIQRPVREPETGGLIERFFLTVQNQFEREVRAGEILTLEELNRTFSAWLSMGYHKEIHSEIRCAPEEKYKSGLQVIRQIDMKLVLDAFLQKIERTVNKTFSDVRLNNQHFKVDPKLRGDRVVVGFDPFSSLNTVKIYSLKGQYLGVGELHLREPDFRKPAEATPEKPKHSYLDLLALQHRRHLEAQTKGIDYRKVTERKAWPFVEFVKRLALLLDRKGGLASFNADELEMLKRAWQHLPAINPEMLRQAFEKAYEKSIQSIVYELKIMTKKEE